MPNPWEGPPAQVHGSTCGTCGGGGGGGGGEAPQFGPGPGWDRVGRSPRRAEPSPEVKGEMQMMQGVIDRRAALFTNRIDNGSVNNIVGTLQGPGMHTLLNATTNIENSHREAYNRNVRARDAKAPLKPMLAERQNFWSYDELMPGCNTQAEAALGALKADPRFEGWELRQVTRGSAYGPGTESMPFSGYHHKVYAKSPVTGQEYSVDMHKGREVRPWNATDADFK